MGEKTYKVFLRLKKTQRIGDMALWIKALVPSLMA